MRNKRKRQVKRYRPTIYRRGRDIYGIEYILISRRGEVPDVKALGPKVRAR